MKLYEFQKLSLVLENSFLGFLETQDTRLDIARKPGDENPFAESYLFYKFVDDGFSQRV